MKTFQKLVSFVLLLGTHPLLAQKSYSLSDCISYGLQHHATISMSRNNMQIAKEGEKQAAGLYLPQLNGTLNVTDNTKQQMTIIPAGIFGPKEMELRFGKQYNNIANLDLSQTIYDQTKINNIRAEKKNVELSKIQSKQTEESIIYSTAQAYFQMLIYKEYQLQLMTNIASYKQLYQILELQLQKGVALHTDLDRIKVNLQSTEYQLNEISTQYKNAINTLKFCIGMPLDEEINIDDSADFSSFVSLPQTTVLTLDNLTDYTINKTNVDLQKIGLQTKQAAFFPTVNAFGRLGYQSYSTNFTGAFDNWKNYSYVGVSVNIPIFSGLRRSSQVKESKLTYKNACENLTLVANSYRLRFDNAEKSLLSAYNSCMSNKGNLDLAQKIFDQTNLSYQKGSVPLSDFLNDDTALKNAQTNYMNSLFSYMIAKLDYEKAKGTLSLFYNQLKTN
jgi:outer membrane protein TolC